MYFYIMSEKEALKNPCFQVMVGQEPCLTFVRLCLSKNGGREIANTGVCDSFINKSKVLIK